MPRRLVPLLLLFCLQVPKPAYPLDASLHRQLVVAVTDSWSDFRATIYLFELAEGNWVRVGKGMPAIVGRAGLAWDPALPDRAPGQPVKKEGDGKAPAGVFPLPLVMGFSFPAGATLPFRRIEEGTHCVDDQTSHYYNRIVGGKELAGPAHDLWHSSERMWELADRYRLLLVVDYNMRETRPGDGSCIFMHIWRSGAEATAGCTALAENDLAGIVTWLKPEAKPALVQMPREDYERVWQQWRLPPPLLLEEDKTNRKGLLVDVREAAPEVAVEMRYAGRDNFTGHMIYDCGRCFLRPQTALKVARAEQELHKSGLSLKLWDCYRPLRVQKLLWSLVPDPRYVADPKKGSRHNRGTAVDATLVNAAGQELEMPTRFDDFSPRAAAGETHLPAHVLENRRLLAETMQRAGFQPLPTEWWHYDDADGVGDLLDVPFGELCR